MKYILLAIFFPLGAFCQTKDVSYLVVKGKAEIQVPVDFMEINLTITSNEASLKTANSANRELVLKLFEILKQFSINDSDFQTTNNSAGIQDYRAEPEKRFSVQYSGILILRIPNVYDSLFEAIASLGNVSFYIRGFGSNQRLQYRMLAYQKAVQAAKREAEMMLKGTQQSVGNIIKLIQDNRDVFTQYDDIDKIIEGPQSLGISAMTVTASNANTIRKRNFTEQVEVTVIFAIK